ASDTPGHVLHDVALVHLRVDVLEVVAVLWPGVEPLVLELDGTLHTPFTNWWILAALPLGDHLHAAGLFPAHEPAKADALEAAAVEVFRTLGQHEGARAHAAREAEVSCLGRLPDVVRVFAASLAELQKALVRDAHHLRAEQVVDLHTSVDSF